MADKTLCFTHSRARFVPERRVTKEELQAGYICVPLRGHGFTLAVFPWSPCPPRVQAIGHIVVDDLGYPDVKSWIEATGWQDQGY